MLVQKKYERVKTNMLYHQVLEIVTVMTLLLAGELQPWMM